MPTDQKVFSAISDKDHPYTVFDVVIVPRGGDFLSDAFIINDFCESIAYDYSIDESDVNINITVGPILDNATHDLIQEGSYVVLFGYVYENNDFVFKEIRRGIIIEVDRDSSGTINQMIIRAKGSLWYALNNNISSLQQAGTATTRIRTLCQSYGIPMGDTFVETGVMLPRRIRRSTNVYELILDDILSTNKQSDTKFIIRMINGRLNIMQRTVPSVYWGIEEGHNLISVSKKTSLEGRKNLVIVRGNKTSVIPGVEEEDQIPQYVAHAVDWDAINRYGLLTEEIIEPDNITQEIAQKIADKQLARKSFIQQNIYVSATNINNINWGDPVWVYERSSNTIGIYWVVSGSHRIDSQGATMDLVLSLEDRYQLLEAQAEEASQKSASALDKVLGLG